MSDVNYVDSNKSTVVRDLESKIDTLQELREKEAIDSEEINQALEIIKEDIKIAILLDEILNTYPEYHDTMGTDNESGIPNMETVERYFVEIGKDYSKYSSQKEADIYMTSPQNQTSASKQEILLEYQKNEYAALKEKLNKINEIYPTFEKLIDDLEG